MVASSLCPSSLVAPTLPSFLTHHKARAIVKRFDAPCGVCLPVDCDTLDGSLALSACREGTHSRQPSRDVKCNLGDGIAAQPSRHTTCSAAQPTHTLQCSPAHTTCSAAQPTHTLQRSQPTQFAVQPNPHDLQCSPSHTICSGARI
eukprot:355096-Chlamydomonas_euryale.AAC.12